MAELELYERVYKCTSISNTTISVNGAAGTKNISLSKFTVSGAVNVPIGEITYVSFKHYHTCSNAGYANYNGINIRSNLLCGATTVSSPYTLWKNFGDVVGKNDVFSNLPTAEQFNALAAVQIQWKSYSDKSSLYYRATESSPMVLIVRYYSSADKQPDGIMRYYNGSVFVNTQPYIYDNGSFVRCLPKYWDGSQWVDIG